MRSRSLAQSERGASAVEFAIVVGLLVLLLAGITQFGITFFHWLEIVHSAREGARWASLKNPDGSVTQLDTTKYKVWEAAPGLYPRLTDADISIDPSNPDDDDVGNPVEVTVTYDSPVVWPLMQDVFGVSGPTLTLTSSATQKVE